MTEEDPAYYTVSNKIEIWTEYEVTKVWSMVGISAHILNMKSSILFDNLAVEEFAVIVVFVGT